MLSQCSAARPFLNEPDTGIETFLGSQTPMEASGTLVPLEDIITVPDFEFAARAYMPSDNYSYYRTGAAGEFSKFISFPFPSSGLCLMCDRHSLPCEFGDL